MNISLAVDNCLADLGLSAATALTYRNGLRRFVAFLESRSIPPSSNVRSINMDCLILFPTWLEKQHTKQTASVYLSAVAAFFDYLIITKALDEPSHYEMLRYKQATKRARRRHESKLPRFPKRDDISKMLGAVRVMTEASPRKERDIALLELLASSGCRISELIALDVVDVDLKHRTMIVMGKGQAERRAYFSQEAAEALVNYWRARKSSQPTDPLFARHDDGAGKRKLKRMTPTTARNIVKQVAMVAGVDKTKVSPHYFRHDFAMRVLSETHDLATTQDLLGHKDTRSTRVYAKIRNDDLQQAHRDVFG
jgi:integrase/recombinase XerD